MTDTEPLAKLLAINDVTLLQLHRLLHRLEWLLGYLQIMLI